MNKTGCLPLNHKQILKEHWNKIKKKVKKIKRLFQDGKSVIAACNTSKCVFFGCLTENTIGEFINISC